jgi:hypothetical protein
MSGKCSDSFERRIRIQGDEMRIKILLTILAMVILTPIAAKAVDQATIDKMVFLLNQFEWNQWADGVFDNITLYDGLTAIYGQAVNDGDDILKRKVIWAMGETGIPEFAPTLVGASESEPIACAYALGKLPSDYSVDTLVGLLSNDDQYVRESAAWGLGNIPYNDDMATSKDRALSALKDQLKAEKEDWVKETISAAITYINTGVATSPAFEKSDTE